MVGVGENGHWEKNGENACIFFGYKIKIISWGGLPTHRAPIPIPPPPAVGRSLCPLAANLFVGK